MKAFMPISEARFKICAIRGFRAAKRISESVNHARRADKATRPGERRYWRRMARITDAEVSRLLGVAL